MSKNGKKSTEGVKTAPPSAGSAIAAAAPNKHSPTYQYNAPVREVIMPASTTISAKNDSVMTANGYTSAAERPCRIQRVVRQDHVRARTLDRGQYLEHDARL